MANLITTDRKRRRLHWLALNVARLREGYHINLTPEESAGMADRKLRELRVRLQGMHLAS